MIDYQSFREWQQKGNRMVEVKMGYPNDTEYMYIFVYDFDLLVGQIVQSVNEIDLVARKKQELEKAIAELESLNYE